MEEEKIEKEIDEFLSKFQFTRTEDKEPTWSKKETSKTPGREIIINGQRFTDPGQDVEILTKIEYWGTGSISDNFSSEELKLFNFSLKVKEGEDIQQSEMSFGLYGVSELETALREFMYRR